MSEEDEDIPINWYTISHQARTYGVYAWHVANGESHPIIKADARAQLSWLRSSLLENVKKSAYSGRTALLLGDEKTEGKYYDAWKAEFFPDAGNPLEVLAEKFGDLNANSPWLSDFFQKWQRFAEDELSRQNYPPQKEAKT